MDVILIVAKPYEGEMMRRMLLDAGYQAEVAEGTAESGDWIEHNRPSAVVLSERLLSGSPRDFLQALREGAHGQAVPVLLVGDAHQLDGFAISGVLARPLDPVQLISGVRALVAEPSARDVAQPAAAEAAQPAAAEAAQPAAAEAAQPAAAEAAQPAAAEAAQPVVAEAAQPARDDDPAATEAAWLASDPAAMMAADSLITAARQRVEAKLAQLGQGDYFSLLEVAPTASESEIETAYAQLCASFSAAQLPAEVVQALGAQLDEIREVLDEAHAILRRDELRAAYREHL